jgi:dihydrodipicolinate synthase/N-acetylneuraminate lyase
MDKFRGLFPAAITPMAGDGEGFDEVAFRKVLEFNIQSGVHGFWLAGGTGESVMLDDEENRQLATAAVDQNRGRVANIMHVGTPTTKRSARLAEHAARAGVEAICCVPPFFYGRTDDEIVEHYRIVGEAADLPLFVYNLPHMTGVEITVDLMHKIQDKVPRLEGLKHSSVNFRNVDAFAQMGLTCFIGSSALMLPALTLGAVGCVDGPPIMAPEFWTEIWNAYQEGDGERAKAAQRRANDVVSLAMAIGGRFHAIVKVVLSHRLGIDCGAPRAPGLPLTEEQRRQIVRDADQLGLGPVEVAP